MTAALATSIIDIDGVDAPVALRVNPRARRLILKIDASTGRPIMTLPTTSSVQEAISFAEQQAAWINARLAETPTRIAFADGIVFPFKGVDAVIATTGETRRTTRFDASMRRLHVGGDAPHVNRRVIEWLRREARTAFSARIAIHAATAGASPTAVNIKDTRSRWGSCSSAGSLSFSWRLVMAPPAVLDYVAAHECAHLIHLNHSARFWRLVDEMGVDRHSAERWLSRHGANLFRWGGAG